MSTKGINMKQSFKPSVKKIFSKKDDFGSLRAATRSKGASYASEQLGDLLVTTHYNEEELLGFFDAFQGVSSRLQPLDKKQFINLCEKLGFAHNAGPLSHITTSSSSGSGDNLRLAEDVVVKEILNTLFILFDSSKSGRIDFKEFVEGVSLLQRGNLDETAKAVFRAYDIDGDGSISREEMSYWVKNAMRSARRIKKASQTPLKESAGKGLTAEFNKKVDLISRDTTITQIVDEVQIFNEADLSRTGSISESEFLIYARKHPETLRILPLPETR